MDLNTKKFETDVLVIGGGLAGTWAVLRAGEITERIILVDKGYVGASGCSTFAAGDILWWTPEDDRNEWIRGYIIHGGYLVDPDWLELLCTDIYDRVLEMDRWGAPFEKDALGKIIRKPGRGHNAAVVFPGFELMKFMRKKVEERKVKILDNVSITRLILQDGRVSGAVGVHLKTGDFYIIKSRSVVVASGGCSWKGNFYGQDMVCGESYALAYNAGAELMNMEYSNSYNSSYRGFDTYGMSRFQRLGGKFTNAKNERFMERYDPEMKDGAYLHTLAKAMAMEVRAGRGPIYFDLMDMKEEDRNLSKKLLPMLFRMFDRAGIDIFSQKLEWVSGFQGSIGSGSGIKLINTYCSSSTPGLFAAGDAACEGLVIGGIAGPGAINLSWAIVTGYRTGEGAAKYSQNTKNIDIDDSEYQRNREYTFGPLNLKEGIDPDSVYRDIQEITVGADFNIIRHEERMNKALSKLKDIQKSQIPYLKAKDSHELKKCHEVISTAITTEMMYKSALMRTESRASHYREDFPDMDNKNWLKWIILRKTDDSMKLSTEPVPVKKYEKYGLTIPQKT